MTGTGTAAEIDAAWYTLDPDEASQLFELSRFARVTYSDPHSDHAITQLSALAGDLPSGLRTFLHEFRLTETGIAVLRNISVADDIGPTPASWQVADTEASRLYSFTALILGSVLGDPIGWQAQQGGRIVTDVLPARGMEHTDVSASSARELSWHTEDGFSPYRADWLALLCLRNPDGVATTVADLDTPSMPAEVEAVLREPRFVFAVDPAHEAVDDEPEPVALLSGAGDVPVLRADRDYVATLSGDSEAAAALSWLMQHLDSRLFDLVLEQGQLALLNNNAVVHGRRAFRASYTASERWLKRINVVRDIRRTQPARTRDNRRILRSL